ncbi:hypothetical protein SETIT_2G357500v2 [Setaria italica]|uniref:Uncharacterized protein n=1 Tax=Setaria italica TaxID=4555 RepID=A0A368Q6M8_SETIT|nr:hypothetical protein SETIT_2G357500v2 [Setaria italica]
MGDLADLACAGDAARSHLAGAGRRDRLAELLELAAADDAAAFREKLAGAGGDGDAAELADGVGLWYGRSKAYEPRTPLMVAATYGSAEVVSLLLGLGCVDVNRRPGVDGATPLHCAASGGSRNAVAIVKLLLAAGADPVTPDSAGRFPADVILAPPASPDALGDLEMLLGRRRGLAVTTSVPSGSSSPPLSSSPDEGNRSPSSRSSSLSPITVDRAKKEYPVDPTLPDIKSSVYASDEFRMFVFKHFVPPPLSPSAANNGGGAAAHWLQGSRLRSSFNARDAQADDLGALLEWESQYLGALSLPQSSRSQPRLSTGLSIHPTAMAPSNLEEMYASDSKVDWGVDNEELVRLRHPAQPGAAGEEPDVSWVQSLVNNAELNGKRGEMAGMASRPMSRPDLSSQGDLVDQTMIASWLEQQMHLEPK